MSKTQDAFHNWLAQQGPLDSVQFWHCWKAASELSAQRIAELEFDNSNLKAVIDRLHLDYQELEAEVARLSGELSLANRTGDHLGMRVRDLKAEVASLRVDAERYRWLRDQHQGVATKVDAEWHEYTEPTEYAWMVFRPTAEHQSEPVGCIPGELDAAIDAARGVK